MVELVLSDDERDTLERWARRHTSSQALALRCRIVLACSEGRSNTLNLYVHLWPGDEDRIRHAVDQAVALASEDRLRTDEAGT